MFETTLYRMVIFFLILAVGFVAAKASVIRRESMGDFSRIITMVLLPVLTFHNTVATSTREMVIANWPILAFAAIFYLAVPPLMMGIARLLRLQGNRDRLFTLCFTFGNTGFIGIPLLAALFPQYGLLFIAMFSIVDQAVFWTYGVNLSTPRERGRHFHLKSLVSPNTVALALAFVFIFAGVPIPGLADDTLGLIANATSAMCMIYLGCLCFFSNWLQALKEKELYVGMAVKMLIVPVVVGHIALLLGLPQDMSVCMVVVASLPVMTATPMIVSQHGTAENSAYATGITVVTLVVSVVTIPVVQLLAFL